jgi:superfamily II DNA or RNA helicase
MNNLSIYNEIIKTRGLRKLNYQEEFLTSEYTSDKPFVLAAGTSSGKTFMAIMKLEIFYSYPQNKNKRTLIIPYSMKVLRDNFSTELDTFKPSFSYCVATTKEELVDCLKSDCQVVVALPQSLSNVSDLLPKFHNFILDEAHQWYGKKTITDILKQIKPNYQLLLTGTPSRFIMKGDRFNFQFVPVMDLFDLKQVTNVRVEVVSSTYDFKQSDYNGTYGNLKASSKMSKKSTDEALTAVCKEMLKRIKNPIKQPNVSRVTKNVLSVFNQIGKTIIFCHSLKQADAIYKSLNGFSELTGKVLVSHSENDTNSEGFIKFKDSDEYLVLVAVDRGKLGFNIPELFNVVDFTLTQSLDMLMQMYGRVLRLSKTDKPKTYYKVATKNTASYYVDLMTAMLCLTSKEWYSKYNGKNMGGILIPKVLTSNKPKSKSPNKNVSSKTVKPKVNITELGIPLDLNLFKSAYRKDNDKFGTIAWTTLEDCRREFYCMTYNGKNNEWLSYEDAKKYVHTLGIKTQTGWNEFVKLRELPSGIPYGPRGIYMKNGEWVDWADWLGNGIVSAFEIGKKHLSYDDAKQYIKPFKFKSSTEYFNYVKDNNIDFLSQAPQGKYRNQGTWKGWGDYLGHGVPSNQERSKNYKDFKSAREFARSLKLKNREEWNEFINTGNLPIDIPRWPNDEKIYPQWDGWGDWLGTGRVKGWQKIKGYKKIV